MIHHSWKLNCVLCGLNHANPHTKNLFWYSRDFDLAGNFKKLLKCLYGDTVRTFLKKRFNPSPPGIFLTGSSRTRSSRHHHSQRPPPPPPVRRPLAQRLRTALRIVVAWTFSNVGICVLVVAYLLLGAVMFQEQSRRHTVNILKLITLLSTLEMILRVS